MLKPEIQAAMNAIEEHLKSINEILDSIRESPAESTTDIQWYDNKGTCPAVPDGGTLALVFRDGYGSITRTPWDFLWEKTGGDSDIVKYRYI